MDNTSAANQKHINSSSAWVMVSLMMVAYIFSFVDRYILGLLIEPIKADLNLTDTQTVSYTHLTLPTTPYV